MIKKTFLLAIFFYLVQSVTVHVLAVKAYPYPVSISQPDGREISIRLYGDEFFRYRTTEDGYLIKQNPKGFYTYAKKNVNGEIVASDRVARNASERSNRDWQFLRTVPKGDNMKRSSGNMQKVAGSTSQSEPQRAFPLTGSPRALVILVNFSDKSFVTPSPQTAFYNMLNEDGYSANEGTGSARDYFMASSFGKFAPTFDVVGPYTLPNTMAHYGKNLIATDNDTLPRQMVIDACTLADNAGLNFAQYDTDNDGRVDNVFIYYAGYNEAEGASENTIWPHRWALANFNTKFDGKSVYGYACTSELRGKTGSNMCGIGTFCHEFGHVLGLPDYYHTAEDKTTLEFWSIMDAGNYLNSGRTPPTYSVYDRFYLGYFTPEQVSTPTNLTLLPLYQGKTQPANTNNQAFLFSATTHNLNGKSPSPTEFFMVEYRKKTGWDTYLPDHGMLIWHIDFNATEWSYNRLNNYTGDEQTASSHMRVYLQPLSGSTTTPGTAFTTGSFTPTTWLGTNINRAITEIVKTDNNVTFKLMGGTPPPTIQTLGSLIAFSTTIGTSSNSQSILVSGSNLTENINITLLDNTHFDIKLSTSSTWSKSLNIAPVNGNVNIAVDIRFSPSSSGIKTDQLGVSSTGTTDVYVNLSGNATNPNAPQTTVGVIENLIQFPDTKRNSTKTKSFNLKTTDLTGDLSLVVSGTHSSSFTVSASSISKDGANNSVGSDITITFSPLTIGNHTATLTISGGGLNPEKAITLRGNGI